MPCIIKRAEDLGIAKNLFFHISDEPSDKDFENFDFDRIVGIIRNLPPIYRDTIYLNIVEGYSVKEISDILEIGNEAVKKRLQRGRKKLIDRLEKEGIVNG